MKKILKPVMIGVVATFAILSVACNTIQGAGKDMESVGKKVEDTAK